MYHIKQVTASDRSTIVLPGCLALVVCAAGEDALLRRPLTGSMHGSLASLCESSACRRAHPLMETRETVSNPGLILACFSMMLGIGGVVCCWAETSLQGHD